MTPINEELALLHKVLEIYDQKSVAEYLNTKSPGRWSRETINRWLKGKAKPTLSHGEYLHLEALLPRRPKDPAYDFDFIDLFAGIGGIRRGFEKQGGRCVFTSEWNKYAVRTYKANYYCDPENHVFNDDIRKVTLSNEPGISERQAYKHIDKVIPDHDVLLAGFPCQPFSIAGVSKKNALGRKHGFECETQGTLFFDVARIIAAKRPAAFVLENVKNLKSHAKGETFRIIMKALDELGYWVADADHAGPNDPKIIDGKHFVPQHRERIVLVGFRKDLGVHNGFSLRDIAKPSRKHSLGQILDAKVPEKYTLTPKLWSYLYNYSIKHKAKGNGFGYGLVTAKDVTRTLSARYYKDGSEILIDQGFNPDLGVANETNMKNRPRRLTPRECARLMGYDEPDKSVFRIPVSDMQAYKQFGNSVVVPVFAAVAKLMRDRILEAKRIEAAKGKLAA
jgi:DNA (cytosine-5)-methyltransferase 1